LALAGARASRRQLAPGAVLGEILERTAARDHQGDHHARQHLAERQRARHRDHGDQIDPHLAPEQGAHHADQDHDQHGQGRARPDAIGQHARAREPRRNTARQAECGQGNQCSVGQSRRPHGLPFKTPRQSGSGEPALA
jgi:hypothetical protein